MTAIKKSSVIACHYNAKEYAPISSKTLAMKDLAKGEIVIEVRKRKQTITAWVTGIYAIGKFEDDDWGVYVLIDGEWLLYRHVKYGKVGAIYLLNILIKHCGLKTSNISGERKNQFARRCLSAFLEARNNQIKIYVL
jgi:hypothetical protein